MAYSPIGDTIALTKLAYTLYSRVIVVATDAPEQFQALLQDLDVYKKVLYRVKNRIEDSSDPDYGVDVQDVLNRCFSTLYGLRDLTIKYENLGEYDSKASRISSFADGSKHGVTVASSSSASPGPKTKRQSKAFGRRSKTNSSYSSSSCRRRAGKRWSSCYLYKKSKSKLCRERLRNRAQQAFTLDDNKTLVARRESGFDAPCTCRLSPITKTTTTATTGSVKSTYDPGDNPSNASPRTIHAGYYPFSKRTLSSTGSTAHEILEDLRHDSRSGSLCTAQTSCSSCHDHIHSRDCLIDERRLTPSYENLQNGNQALSIGESSLSDQGPGQTKTRQPLVLLQEREKHDVSSEAQDVFRSHVESVEPSPSLERWLQLAIWWLVKSRIISRILAQSNVKRRGTDASQHQSRWHSTVSMLQAYTDLLKSSWILEEVVLVGTADEDLSYPSVKQVIEDLSRSLHNELQESRNLDQDLVSFEKGGLLKYDLYLLERFEQKIEAEESIPAAIDDPVSALRWFEIDQDNAGMQHEKVLFRTFVNAQLGRRSNRSKSPSAPYMLLLWTAANNCDIFISLCNLRGSVNLSRKVAAEDLERYKAGDDPTLFSIKFPTQEAEIKFLSPEDADEFFAQPLVFFAALEDIKPRPGELAIYQTSLSSYSDSSPQAIHERLRARTMKASETSSCGLRVYELMPDKCWKTTRRLVINTPPDSSKPGCASHWLPADQIKMVVEWTKVTVKWSDCGQLIKKELGNFVSHYSYIYKAGEPNRKIDLDFGSPSDAQAFKNCLLLPTELPPQVTTKIEIQFAFQDIRISRLEDVDEPDQQYHSIALTKKNPKGPHTTEIYYVYRDLDWIISIKNGIPSIINFPSLQTSHYVSTMPRLQYKPNASDPTPEFSDVEVGFRAAQFELGCDHDLKKFMNNLTGWTLKFYRPLSKLTLVGMGHLLMKPKEQYKGVSVQVWEKAAEEGQPRIQLAVRLCEEKTDPWITASLFEARCRSEHSSMSYNVEFPALSLKRGIEIDTKCMSATTRGGSNEEATNKRRWRTTLTFVNTESKWMFPVENQGMADRK